jgi:conjugal transfer pilus assembly protein TrbC
VRTELARAFGQTAFLVAMIVGGSPAAVAQQAGPDTRMPSPAEIDARMQHMKGSMPNLEALTPSPSGTVDIGAMAAKAEHMQEAATDATVRDSVSGLLVFVSLGMPAETLDRIVDQARRYHARLVLRGLKNRSIKQTATQVREILHNRPVSWLIDPKAFTRFAVDSVPAFVLVDPNFPMPMGCEGTQCPGTSFSKLTGDVSTEFALREMAAADPQLGPLATDILSKAAAARR